jgi:hypothetical protein
MREVPFESRVSAAVSWASERILQNNNLQRISHFDDDRETY